MPKRFAKILLMIMFAVPIMTACSREPARKVIEYDEEVRLHDGSMIWVRITRHYRRVGALGQGSGYKEVKTEVSWDTGFEGVGKKTVEFSTNINFINKFDEKWYVFGGKYACKQVDGKKGVYVNGECVDDIGTRVGYPGYLYVIGKKGNFLVNQDIEKLSGSEYVYNILDYRGLPNVGNPPIELQGKYITWKNKEEFRKVQKDYGSFFGKPVRPQE